MDGRTVLLFGFLLSINQVSCLWTCTTDSECTSTLSGSVCNGGVCECGSGTQAVLGGTACIDIAPYHTSPCVEDHQCARLFSGFQCHRDGDDHGNVTGNCICQPGFHYLYGRCWRSVDYGSPCTQSEECLGVVRDPFSLSCNVTCVCAEGYVERQRGDCRRIGFDVGAGCVIDQDCDFPNGACDLSTFSCISTANSTRESNYEITEDTKMADINMVDTMTTVQRVICNTTDSCPSPFICSNFGVCICPSGYYESDDGQMCLAELGSPSEPNQCVGLLAEVIDGICSCRPNFFYEDNMRDCIRVTRRITDSCVLDTHCHTFGPAARCGQPQPPWGLRTCECIPEVAVWWESGNMCRYYSGIGESCQENSDCLAGDLEIQCVVNNQGEGVCTCPEGLVEVDGLCLTSGLGLGDTCQHNLECTATPNSICDGVCICDEGYQAVDGICAPSIGGSCNLDTDCAIENTVCRNTSAGRSCQCDDGFVTYDNVCWPEVAGYNSTCTVSAQCTAVLGVLSVCDSVCSCAPDTHYRDGSCWPVTGLFEPCSRTSQCYLYEISERVVCRNSQCQCDFNYPFSEEQQTCLSSSASYITKSLALIFTTLLLLVQ